MRVSLGALVAQAESCERQQQWKEASGLYQLALSQSPRCVSAATGLARLCVLSGQYQQALQLYKQAKQVKSALPVNDVLMLSAAQEGLGCYEAALPPLQKILAVESNNRDAWFQLGRVLLRQKRYNQAAGAFQQLLSFQSDDEQAADLYALSLLKSSHHLLAASLIGPLYRKWPNNSRLALSYVQALCLAEEVRKAFDVLESVSWDGGVDTEAMIWRAIVNAKLGHKENFKQLYGQLQDRKLTTPQRQELELAEARLHLQAGDTESGLALLNTMIKAYPDFGPAWEAWLDAAPTAISEEEIEQLENQAQDSHDETVASTLYFSLAKAKVARNDLRGEVEALERANALAAKSRPVYEAEQSSYAEWACGHFTADRIRSLSEGGDYAFRPIFILAMPRSGTTLLEQVLSGHSQVVAAGESGLLSYVLQERQNQLGVGTRSGYLEKMDPDEISVVAQRLRTQYRELVGNESVFVTDKGMGNIRDAGLLSALFPKATMVLLERHPMDVGWGCYKQNFTYQNFSFSYRGIASEYRRFRRLRDHWKSLPDLALVEVQYESLVNDLQSIVSPILEAAGLAWESGCRDFQTGSHSVMTASLHQVRQRLFSSGVGRWRAYGDLLSPLRESFLAEGLAIPDD